MALGRAEKEAMIVDDFLPKILDMWISVAY